MHLRISFKYLPDFDIGLPYIYLWIIYLLFIYYLFMIYLFAAVKITYNNIKTIW